MRSSADLQSRPHGQRLQPPSSFPPTTKNPGSPESLPTFPGTWSPRLSWSTTEAPIGPPRKRERRGARVVFQPDRGYGAACLAGIAALPPETEVVLFLDGDYSDDPAQARELLQALEKHQADLVLGSRTRGGPEPGSLTPQQRFGNWLSTRIIRLIYGHAYTDLGPFRVIRREALSRLDMQDRTYGWTVEMQVKALQQELKVVEIPVSYRPRLGRSKVSGTLSGTFKAGFKILWTIARLSLRNPLV